MSDKNKGKSNTSFGVMKTNEFEDAVFYRVACDCGSKDCDISLELEFDKKLKMLFLNMFQNFRWTCGVYPDSWWSRTKKRVFGALRILFTGYIEVEGELVLRDINHVDSFIGALKEGKEKLVKVSDD